MMYFRFLLLLSLGLFGMSLLMTTVLDSLFQDWSVHEDIQRYVDAFSVKAQLIPSYEYEPVEARAAPVRPLGMKTPLPREIRLVEAASPLSPMPQPAGQEALPLPPVARRPALSSGPRVSLLTPPPPPRTPAGP
ncbi:MAG TPA: hypothetical protein VNI01_13340 [Elusimicrobiota bacterium]|jgi:hypothetical protein|nr:hypothetical protein [Elusimicrobiota bacterium]